VIRGIFGDGSVYRTLRTGLDEDMRSAQFISDRVANAANQATTVGGAPAPGAGPEINLEEELVNLVDTTLRFDAETRLLREAYARLRTAIGTNG
jgi:hypothetical protein